MCKYITILAILVFSLTTYSQNYKQVRINTSTVEEIAELQQSGMQFDHPVINKDGSVEVFISENDFLILKQSRFSYQILIDDWTNYYNNLPVLTEPEKQVFRNESALQYGVDGFDFGSMGGFYTYQEIIDNLDSMFAQYPDIITEKFPIGTSQEGRTIWAVKISDNPGISEDEPAVGFDALIHAREPASMATLMYFMFYILENYGTDPVATYLVNNREIYCVPCFNPDGYEYNRVTNPNGGGMWRKNRRINGGGCIGVDLNRNYSYKWGYDNIGSSPDPCSDTYRGPSPISEPETQAVTDFINSKHINTYFNMHSYSDAFLFPWGYINQACPDEETYTDFCIDLSNLNGFVWGTGGQVLGYNSNGSARDWLYGEQIVKNKIFGYTMEIGNSSDGFWPPQSRIFPIVQNSLPALIYNAWVAGDYVLLENANPDQQYFNPGDLVELFPSFKNKGLTSSYNLSVELSSSSPYINITNGTVTFDSIEARSSVTVSSPFSFSIDPSVPAEEMIELIFTVRTNGEFMSESSFSFIIGTPAAVFADTTNDPNVFWTITATPSNPKWEATTTTYYSAPNSYTDSKNGNYASNATVTMTLSNSIDISAYQNPILSFWTKFDIENNWDYGQVEVSTNNGTTWIPLEGNYTNPGTGSFQPNGEPLYDGTQQDWVREEISLSSYTSDQFKVRFQLRSDGFVQEDGWYLDDISVIYYSVIPVELVSFSANVNNNSVRLNWQTATETNNNGFEIERSQISNVKGQMEWNQVAFVPGFGTTTEPKSYSFTDENLSAGKYQYRLKQIDFDGTFEYSNTIEVEVTAPTEFSLSQNYPNPFNPTTKIGFSLPVKSFVTIKIYDVLGNEISTLLNDVMDAGRHTLEFNASNLSSGVYMYQLITNEFIQTKKMIISK
ncbi:MAG: hypothetical protein Kow0098_24490 [Ignavibacteriaceae bacterium]